MYACMHVCMYACMYACMYVCMYSTYIFIDSTYLSEANLVIFVFINCSDHLLKSQVGLWLSKFLHHQLKLHKIYKMTAIQIISLEKEKREQV